MSKRKIIAALKRKCLEAKTCEYGQETSPGESYGAWTVELTEESENKLLDAGVDVWDLEPDAFNSSEVLEWIAGLPDCTPAGRAALAKGGGDE